MNYSEIEKCSDNLIEFILNKGQKQFGWSELEYLSGGITRIKFEDPNYMKDMIEEFTSFFKDPIEVPNFKRLDHITFINLLFNYYYPSVRLHFDENFTLIYMDMNVTIKLNSFFRDCLKLLPTIADSTVMYSNVCRIIFQ